ncbi:MAG TPA: NADP-dependent phosphogluconate dehydrogenase, partial [Bacillota bacterium]
PYFTAISAHVNQEPCCRFLGPDGAGHFVKMVHNGIEYADMQLISEAYLLLRELGGMSPAELQQIFTEWNQGDLNSYLIEITAAILGKTDADTEKPMVDMIMDRAGQKGTGRWTVQEALELGTAIPAVAEAVFARCLSTLKEERVQAAKELTGPAVKPEGDRKALIQAVQEALYASKICSYAQGFAMLGVASQNYHWQLDLGEIALLWRGGCIIRAQFLNRIKEAYAQNRDLAHLMLADYFKERLIKADESWRRVVGLAVANGLSVPVFSAALSYYDSYRRSVLPANLIQAQRDYFGAHTYERVDRTGIYHSEWEVPEKRITSVKADA